MEEKAGEMSRLDVGRQLDGAGLARGDSKFSNWAMHFISLTAPEQAIGNNEQFVSLTPR